MGSQTGQRRRVFWWLRFAFVMAFMMMILAAGGWFVREHYRMQRHGRSYNAMELALLRLAVNPPDDVTEDRWAFCVHWAWNLNANYGGLTYISTESLDQLRADLDARVESGPDLSTINWYWDAYEAAAPRSNRYRHYHPLAPDNEMWSPNGSYSLDEWRQRYREVTEE